MSVCPHLMDAGAWMHTSCCHERWLRPIAFNTLDSKMITASEKVAQTDMWNGAGFRITEAAVLTYTSDVLTRLSYYHAIPTLVLACPNLLAAQGHCFLALVGYTNTALVLAFPDVLVAQGHSSLAHIGPMLLSALCSADLVRTINAFLPIPLHPPILPSSHPPILPSFHPSFPPHHPCRFNYS